MIIENKQTESVPLAHGAIKIRNLRKFLRDCFRNLPQRFIRIQEYFNNVVVLKKKSGPRVPQTFRNPKVLYLLLLNFWRMFHWYAEVFL